jgi:hypothetical protein
MAYDIRLAERVRRSLARRRGMVERSMFGGLAFMVGGRMCCGIVGDRLMVRVGSGGYEDALARPHARMMDFTGRPLRGFVYVEPAGVATAAMLDAWIARAEAFAPAPKSGKTRGAVSASPAPRRATGTRRKPSPRRSARGRMRPASRRKKGGGSR